jgi:hypothetical protein
MNEEDLVHTILADAAIVIEPPPPRLLTDAEAVAVRAYLPEAPAGPRKARMQAELTAYDAAHARIADESEMPR